MNSMHRTSGREHPPGPKPTRPWPVRIGFWLLLAVAAFYLLTEHRAHLFGGAWLPLVLLACPLLHLFGHRGHGGHGAHGATHGEDASADAVQQPRKPNTHGGDLP